jgi:EmrB/QacA subfamily drug resistance transporter
MPDRTEPEMSASQQRWVLTATILGSSMAFVDSTGVNVALQTLQSFFRATGAQAQWIVEIYALFLASLLLVGGSLGDRYGKKFIFMLGAGVFAAASAACGFAQTLHQLIGARALQGIGAAMLVPGSLALLSASLPDSTRGKAIGTWSGFTAITAALGPLAGGWVVQKISWRWVFFINLPLALATLLICIAFVPETRIEGDRTPIDWPGAVLATTGLGSVTFALIEFSYPTKVTLPIGLLGMVLLAAFAWVQTRSPRAMIPPAVFRSRNFSGANLLTLLLYAALGGVLYFLPLNLMQVQHYSPRKAGAALLPLILLIFFLSRWSAGLVRRYGARLPLTVGPSIAAAGFALLTLPGREGSYWTTFFPAVMVLGLGLAVSVAPLTTVVMSSLPKEMAGSASGINNAVSQVASLIAIAVFGILLTFTFNASLKKQLQAGPVAAAARQQIWSERSKLAAIVTTDRSGEIAIRQAFVVGFRNVATLAALLALLSAGAAAWLIRNTESPGTHQSQ